jgi:hypothetical protein
MRSLRELYDSLWSRPRIEPTQSATRAEEPVARPTPALVTPGTETISRPGDGKSSFLWASIYLLRKLGLVWPNYVHWAQDPAHEEAMSGILERMRLREKPLPGGLGCAEIRLLLSGMERWGERHWTYRDQPDAVFSATPEESDAASPALNWAKPVIWLVSLPDLANSKTGTAGVPFDSLFERVLQARQKVGFERQRLRIILTLTKADRITDLPRGLRDYLKRDPLAKLVALEDRLVERGIGPDHDLVNLADGTLLAPGPLRHYLQGMQQVHEDLRGWLGRSLGGRLLLRRAEAQHVDLRITLCSATGSDLWQDDKLAVGWQPKRVLDATFWAFELSSPALRW